MKSKTQKTAVMTTAVFIMLSNSRHGTLDCFNH